jgi:hypothetical protein
MVRAGTVDSRKVAMRAEEVGDGMGVWTEIGVDGSGGVVEQEGREGVGWQRRIGGGGVKRAT